MLLHDVELYPRGKRVQTVTFLVDFQLDDPLLPRVHLHRELVLLLLSYQVNVLLLLQTDCLAQIVVISRFVGVVIVNVAGN